MHAHPHTHLALTLALVLLTPDCASRSHGPQLPTLTTGQPKYQVPSSTLPIILDANVPNELLVCFGSFRRDEWRCVTVEQLRVLVGRIQHARAGAVAVAGTLGWIPARAH